MTIRVLRTKGTHGQIGTEHGETFAQEIRHYAEERIGLVMSGRWGGHELSRSEVLAVAESCLDAHEEFSSDLTAEMVAIGAAAGLTPAEMIVVGGFTDFVDTVYAVVGGPMPDAVQEDDCTGVITPDWMADGEGLFAQTWDMHDTATEFVVLTDVRPEGKPRALVFTTTGCVGQLGMNELGVCVGINNLTAADGRVGVTWPHVVRKALEATSAADAREIIDAAPVSGGHNYFLYDAHDEGHLIEAMATVKAHWSMNGRPLIHTNHALAPRTIAVEQDRPTMLAESSHRRYARATELMDTDHVTIDDLMALTRDQEAICQTPVDPYRIESSGAAIMRPKTLDFWAVAGLPTENQYRRFSLGPLQLLPVRMELADQMVALERRSFPNHDHHHLLDRESVAAQCRLFPDGGVVILDADTVVGQGMGIFVDFDLTEPQHSFEEVCGEDGVSNHDPDGDWYYGTDIAVNGAYRGFGIGRMLYEHRKDIVRRHNRKGIIAGGVIPGYAGHKHEMSAEEYVHKVVAGELFDPTLTFQLRNGFECLGVIADYLPDEATDGWASFIIWRNPDHDPRLDPASDG